MSPLIAIAAQVGAPLVERVLAGRIGGTGAQLVTDTLSAIAREAGVAPDVLNAMAASGEPDQVATVEAAMSAVEAQMPELLTLYQAELDAKMAIFEQEAKGPWWTWAWRPAGMWMLGFLWLYNVALLHWANAFWKIALPPVEFSVLLQISVLYMSLYMGGHTVKSVVANWVGGRRNG